MTIESPKNPPTKCSQTTGRPKIGYSLIVRPQAVAQKQFLQHRDALEGLDLPSRFRYIFEKNLWSGEESRSGIGSSLQETEILRRELPLLLKHIGAASLLDIPCGDFRWLSEVELPVSYIGADIVEAIVAANRQRFETGRRKFLRLDLTADPLPRADVVLCRDCLVHLSFKNIALALANIKSSGAQYLLATNFPETDKNYDIADSDWRTLNFEKTPFNFPSPYRSIVENCMEADGAFKDKSLDCWRLADLPVEIASQIQV